MKKIISLVLVLALALTMMFALASCAAPTAKVAVQKGTTSKMYADLLKGIEVASYDTFALAAKDMKNGNADYVIVDKTTAKALCNEIDGLKIMDIALSTEYYGIAVDKEQAALKDQINNILATKKDQIDDIMAKYNAGLEATYVGVESAEKNVDNAAGQLVVATNAEFAPWEYKGADGKYYGIDMEIAALIADELDLELVIEDMDFDNVVGSVGKQGIDIAMSGITITAEREKVVNFSDPYFIESIVVVCNEDDTSLDAAGTVVDILTVLCTPAEEE